MATITTQELLDSAKAAYASALKAYSVGNGSRTITQQSIDKLSAEIDKLEAKLAAEKRGACGQYGPATMYADFSRPQG